MTNLQSNNPPFGNAFSLEEEASPCSSGPQNIYSYVMVNGHFFLLAIFFICNGFWPFYGHSHGSLPSSGTVLPAHDARDATCPPVGTAGPHRPAGRQVTRETWEVPPPPIPLSLSHSLLPTTFTSPLTLDVVCTVAVVSPKISCAELCRIIKKQQNETNNKPVATNNSLSSQRSAFIVWRNRR